MNEETENTYPADLVDDLVRTFVNLTPQAKDEEKTRYEKMVRDNLERNGHKPFCHEAQTIMMQAPHFRTGVTQQTAEQFRDAAFALRDHAEPRENQKHFAPRVEEKPEQQLN